MFHTFLIKYAEIGLKGKNRYVFEDALVSHIHHSLKRLDGKFTVTKEAGRIYATTAEEFDYDEVIDALKKVFGIAAICPMVQLEDNGYDDLKVKIVEYVDKAYPDKHFTFKVNTPAVPTNSIRIPPRKSTAISVRSSWTHSRRQR